MKATETKKWDYKALQEAYPDQILAEIIHGELIMSPSPSAAHQRVSRKFQKKLETYIENNSMGEVFNAPLDVLLSDTETVQPDVFVILSQNHSVSINTVVEGVPNLIAEVVSPTSVYRDYTEKKELYESFGVAEYWIIDPGYKVIEVLYLENGRYKIRSSLVETGTVSSALLPGFQVEAKDLF